MRKAEATVSAAPAMNERGVPRLISISAMAVNGTKITAHHSRCGCRRTAHTTATSVTAP